MTEIDIEDLRRRHANSILNTATGRALGRALNELEELKNLNENVKNLFIRHQTDWLRMMILNEGKNDEEPTDRNSDPLPSSDR
jgi:hypothetical protein